MRIVPPGDELVWLLDGHLRGQHRVLIVKDAREVMRLSKMFQKLYESTQSTFDILGDDRPHYINNAANHIMTATAVRNARFPPNFGGRVTEYGIAEVDLILAQLLRVSGGPAVVTTESLADPDAHRGLDA